MSTTFPFSKDSQTQPRCHPAVTAWVISNTADWHLKRCLEMPRSAKSFITRIHLPESRLSKRWGTSSRRQNTTLSSLQSTPTFLVPRGVFPPLPSDLSAPSRGAAAVSSEPYSKNSPGGSIMQIINLSATKQLPSILGSCCVNGWQEKPRRIGLQERAAIYLFIFLPV